MEPEREKCHRPYAFDKMEGLVREMQDSVHGVPVRSQKLFLTSVPSAFMGYDLIEWLMERLNIEESEALNLANQLCQFGYFFPVSDSKNLVVKDDSSLYRFQSAYYWPWQNRPPDNVEYAIYLAKRTLRNKQRHGLEDYEIEALGNLRKNLANKWDFITMQAEEQVKLSKVLKKGDKVVSDSQERAYWRIHRPPPGLISSLEQCPVPNRRNGAKPKKKTIEDCQREVDWLRNNLSKTRIKVSQALESMVQYVETYSEYDPLITGTQPSNPWVSEDLTFWQLNGPFVEIPTEKRVKRWALSMEELVSDPTGLQEFTSYLRKEYSHENIRFWMAVNDLRRSSQSQIQRKVCEIFEEFLAPGAPCEINIDGKTMEKVHQEMKTPTRFTFDAAQDHVYTLLLKKDCYPRFIRSEHYKNLLAAGIQPLQKKRFFGFGQTKKKTSTNTAPNPSLLQQQNPQGAVISCGALSKRRGSDRSLSGSAHELAVSGVRDSRVPHSHSQSNLSDIPYRAEGGGEQTGTDHPESAYRVKKPSIAVVAGASTSEDVCPWESVHESSSSASVSRSRKNSIQMDSGSSSSDVSVAVADVSDRLRRTCGLTQQNTLDGGLASRKLSTASCMEPRRASVCVPITTSSDNASGARRNPLLSSFEDTSVTDVTATVPQQQPQQQPQQPLLPVQPSSQQPQIPVVSSPPTPPPPTTPRDPPAMPIDPSDTDNNKRDEATTSKTIDANDDNNLVKVTGSNAPIISVSSVTDDDDDDDDDDNDNGTMETAVEHDVAVAAGSAQQQQQRAAGFGQPLAPLAEPDSESPASEQPPEPIQSSDVVEAKSNDVCPWEDEETCKVDAPFVKTYATLGYL